MNHDTSATAPLADELRRASRRSACARCERTYCEVTNLGTWQCAVHWGTLDEHLRYTCCGARDDSNGCVPCDHVSYTRLYQHRVAPDQYVHNYYALGRYVSSAWLANQQRRHDRRHNRQFAMAHHDNDANDVALITEPVLRIGMGEARALFTALDAQYLSLAHARRGAHFDTDTQHYVVRRIAPF